MKAFRVSFNIYAESQEEADHVSRMFADFVDNYGKEGIAVSASKLLSAPKVWETNPFVRSQITKLFSK